MSAIEITLIEGVQLEAKGPLATNPVRTDVSKGMGGAGDDMSPTDLLAVSLGSCMLTMMGMLAKKLKLDIRGAKVEVTKTMVLQPELKFTGFHVIITVPQAFDAGVQAQLEDAAHHCPVHTAIREDIKQDVKFQRGG